MHVYPRALALAALLLAFAAGPAEATHFRGSNVSWEPSATNRADIKFTASFARNQYSGTDPDGSLAVGDTFQEDVGGTEFSRRSSTSAPPACRASRCRRPIRSGARCAGR